MIIIIAFLLVVIACAVAPDFMRALFGWVISCAFILAIIGAVVILVAVNS